MKLRALVSFTILLCIPGMSSARQTNADVRGPAWINDCAVLYLTFDGKEPGPALNRSGLSVTAETKPAPGLFGNGCDATAKSISVKGEGISPARPLTLSFLWMSPKDLTVTEGCQLFTFQGKGIVSAFVAGKGDWCALQKQAGVLQVYYFPGIQNVNDIYDFDLAANLKLKAGVWHHTVVVFRRASLVELHTDGKRVADIVLSGRVFTPADAMQSLEIGRGLFIDEVVLMNRALDADQIADYFQGVERLHQYDEISIQP